MIKKQKETKKSKEWKDSVGKEAIEKMMCTRNSKEWQDTTGKVAVKKKKETSKFKGKWYNIFNHNGELIYEIVDQRTIRVYSQALVRSFREKPAGHTNISKARLNKVGKLHLIGHYIEEVHPSEETKLKRSKDEIVLFKNIH